MCDKSKFWKIEGFFFHFLHLWLKFCLLCKSDRQIQPKNLHKMGKKKSNFCIIVNCNKSSLWQWRQQVHFCLNWMDLIQLPYDEFCHFLMDLLRFIFQNKKMVNLNFWLGHCFDYCTTKINILGSLILWEMEINFFYFYYSVLFLYT